jgi:hypothetical protein
MKDYAPADARALVGNGRVGASAQGATLDRDTSPVSIVRRDVATSFMMLMDTIVARNKWSLSAIASHVVSVRAVPDYLCKCAVNERVQSQVHGRRLLTMFSQNSKQRDRNAAGNGEASQPLLNGSHEDLTGGDLEDDPHLLFAAPADDEDSEGHTGRSPTPRRGEHTVRFREEVQVIGPPLKSTMQSREAGAYL